MKVGTTAAPVIRIRGLSFAYGPRPVIEDVNLDIGQGDFLGLIGPNGGGKTTLMKLILGMLKPTAGSIEVFGQTPKKARSHIGHVPQYAQFDADFPVTVREAVLTGRLGHAPFGRPFRDQDQAVAETVMDKLGLLPLAHRELRALSGGELQRTIVARALAGEPRILLLDEPTASVDSHNEENLYGILRELNQTIPIVLVSHDLGFISAFVTHVACLNRRLVTNPVSEVHASDLEEMYHSPVKAWSHNCEL